MKMIAPVRYAAYLQAQSSEIKGTRSAKKTRLRLLAALARLLEQADFNDIKVEDITREAGLAKGTFFIYFKTKEDIVLELMTTYLDFERVALPEIEAGDIPYHGVRQIVEWYEKSFEMNHGVLSCLVRLSGNQSYYHKLWLDRNARLLDSWTPLAMERLGLDEKHQKLMRHVIHAVGAIMDQAMFERYGLTSVPAEDPLDLEELIEMHVFLIHRAVYGMDPPSEFVRFMRPLQEQRAVRKEASQRAVGSHGVTGRARRSVR
jgi:AcrR family transcriptional regulator